METKYATNKKCVVHFNPDGVVYKIDEDLIVSLIKRGAFNGLKDGREHDLGEARISVYQLIDQVTDIKFLIVFNDMCGLALFVG